MNIHLRGALSTPDAEGLGPWLATWELSAGVRRTVVARLAVPDGWSSGAGRIAAIGPLATDAGPVWLTTLVEGASLDELFEADPDVAAPILRRLAADLRVARRGLPQPLVDALDGSAVRVRPDGTLTLLPPRQGVPPRRDALVRLDGVDPAGALASREEVAAWVEAHAEPLATRADAWSGRSLTVKLPAEAPTKAVVARFGVFTLALGLAAGWVMAPREAAEPHYGELAAPGAKRVELRCEGFLAHGDGDRLPLPPRAGRCAVIASYGDDVLHGVVDTRTGRMYECEVKGGALQCLAMSPQVGAP